MSGYGAIGDIMDAFFGGVAIERETQVTAFTIRLTPAQANALYNDIVSVSRELDMETAPSRKGFFALFALYDALNAAGVDGAS